LGSLGFAGRPRCYGCSGRCSGRRVEKDWRATFPLPSSEPKSLSTPPLCVSGLPWTSCARRVRLLIHSIAKACTCSLMLTHSYVQLFENRGHTVSRSHQGQHSQHSSSPPLSHRCTQHTRTHAARMAHATSNRRHTTSTSEWGPEWDTKSPTVDKSVPLRRGDDGVAQTVTFAPTPPSTESRPATSDEGRVKVGRASSWHLCVCVCVCVCVVCVCVCVCVLCVCVCVCVRACNACLRMYALRTAHVHLCLAVS
jgi:hypothetical protein